MSIFSKEFWDKMEASVNMTKDTLSTLILIKQKRSAMSQQENKPFQWTDDLVAKFFMDTYRGGFYQLSKHIADFKASSSSSSSSEKLEKDWEIESYIFSPMLKQDILVRKGDMYWSLANYEKSPEFAIHSVRRLSDNTIWTVGDDMAAYGTITKFKIQSDKWMVAHTDSKCGVFIEDFKKAPIPEPKKPLFTTEDGRPAYKGDVVYLLCFESWSLTQVVAAHSPLVGHEKEYKYFSTEKSAIEFIVMNRAVFSLKDIMNELVSETTGRSTLLWKEKNKLTQLAKSKINKEEGK